MRVTPPFLRWLVYFVWLIIGLGLSFGQATAEATPTPLLTYELRPTAAAPLRWHGPDGIHLILGANSAPATLHYNPTNKELWLTNTGLLDVKGLRAPGTAELRAATIRLHDSPTAPVQVAVAGHLTLHAETIDLFALQHPASWLTSGGDMILRSPNPILGDAHYSTGGDFRLEDEHGRPADLLSPHDPIVLASGNVSFGAYTGASLHVVAGGSITAGGAITINGTDTAANTIHPANATLFNASDPILRLATIPLSNGQIVTVRGNIRPTLDLRAGVDWTTFAGGAPSNGVIGAGITPSYAAATTADITTQAIVVSDLNGLVLLSNQYRPNAALPGHITTGNITTNGSSSGFWAGDVTLDSKGNLNTGNINANVSAPNFADDGGDVRLLAGGDVTTLAINTWTQVTTADSVASNGGYILVRAGGNISTGGLNSRTNASVSGGTIGNSGDVTLIAETGDIFFSGIDTGLQPVPPATAGKAGNVTVRATNGSINTTSGAIFTRNDCFGSALCQTGQSGDIWFEAGTGINLPPNFNISTSSNADQGQSNGRAGNITMHTAVGNIALGNLSTHANGNIGSVTRAGQVQLSTGQGSVTTGFINGFARTPDGHITSDTGGVAITASTGITVNSFINISAQNNGINTLFTTQNVGHVHLYTSNGPIFVNGSINASNDADFISGRGGHVTLHAPNGPITVINNMLTNANALTAGGQGGDGGHVTVNAGGNIQTANIDTGGSVGAGGTLGSTGDINLTSAGGNVTVNFLDTGIFGDGPYTTDKAGDITIFAPNGSVTVNSANLYTRNECTVDNACDVGAGGDIFISASTGINLPPNNTIASTSNSNGRVHGRSGDITLLTEQGNILINNLWTRNEATIGSVIQAGYVTLATGEGAIQINVLNGFARTPDGDVLENNGGLVVTATTGITITNNLFTHAQNEASNTPYTTQNAGNVSLYTSNGPIFINGGINASSDGDAGSGNGGAITLTAPNGPITLNNNMLTNANATTAGGQAGNGGDVTVTAGGNIQMASIDTGGPVGTGGTLGPTGNINLTSTGGNITFGILDTGIGSNVPITTAKMGDITVLAPTGNVTILGNALFSRNECFTGAACNVGQGGDIFISASTGINFPANLTIATTTQSVGRVHGRSGDITFLTEQGDIALQSGIIWVRNEADLGPVFRAGHVTMATGQGAVRINTLEGFSRTPDGDVLENNGNLVITATTGITITSNIQRYAQNEASNTPYTTQNGGNISLYTSNGPILVNGALNAYTDGDAGSGNGGHITLSAPNGSLTVNGSILTNANGLNANGQAGNGGHVTLTAGGNIQIGSVDTAGVVGVGGTIGRSGDIQLTSTGGNLTFAYLDTGYNFTSPYTTGRTGDITALAPNGSINLTSNNMRTANDCFGNLACHTHQAGDVYLSASTGINLPANFTLSASSNSAGQSSGRGGHVTLLTQQGDIVHTGSLWTLNLAAVGDTSGGGHVTYATGQGSVILNFAETLTYTPNGQAGSGGSVTITATTGITVANRLHTYAQNPSSNTPSTTGNGGDVSLYTSNGPIFLGGGGINASSDGDAASGRGGHVTLHAPHGAITLNSSILTNANAPNANGQAGDGGHVTLTAGGNIQITSVDTAGSVGAGGSIGRSGDIALTSTGGNLTFALLDTTYGGTAPYTTAKSGDITVLAPNGSVNVNSTNMRTANDCSGNPACNTGQAGDILVSASTGINLPAGFTISTSSNSGGQSSGRGGHVTFLTEQGDIVHNGNLWTVNYAAVGDTSGGGHVTYATGQGSVILNFAETISRTPDGDAGSGGNVTITATTGITIANRLLTFAQNQASNTPFTTQNGGDVSLYTSNGPIFVGNSGINASSDGDAASGRGGQVTLSAPNGPITLNGFILTNANATNAGGQAGIGSPITLTASGHIQTNGLNSAGVVGNNGTHAGGGHITLASGNGNVTFNNFLQTGFSSGNLITTGPAGNATITAPNGQIASNITTLLANNDSTNLASNMGSGGHVTIQAGTGFNWPANFAIRTNTFSNGQVNGRAGNINLTTTQGDILMGFLSAHNHAGVGNSQAGGNINVSTNDGSIQMASGIALSTYSRAITGNTTASAGNITLNATQGINVTNGIWSFTFANGTAQYGGDVQLTTSNGNITVADINASLTAGQTGWRAGDILLTAPNGTIAANQLLNANANTAANTPVQAGNIALTSSGNIQTQAITANAPSGPAQQGGLIELTSGQMVRTLGNITADGVASGITITHGGNGVIPFIVGDATTNGSTGLLATADTQIVPTNSYLYTHHETPNIWIISVDGPNLAVSKQVTPSLIDQGETVTYTVVLTNSGPTAANGLVLTDALPPEVVFGSWLAQPSGAVQAGQAITWTGNLAVSTAVTLQFTAVHIGNYGDVVTNTANYLLTAQPSLNGSASATFTVSGPPNVSVGKSVSATSPALPGQPVSYTISVANESATAVARNVVITDTIPAQLTGLSVSASGLTILNTTGSYVWELADLAPNQSGTIVVSGFINPAVSADVTFTNTVTLSADGDTDPSNNSASVALTVQLPRAQMGTATFAIGEPNGPALLNVTLDRAQPYRPVTVTATTSDGTANAGSDYTAITQTVVFAPNQTTAVVAIPILDDGIQEGSEDFSLTLSAPDGVLLGTPTTTVITIVDNDDTTGVLITPVLLAVAEGGATDSYEVRLGSAPTDTVTITITPDGQLTTSSAVLTFTAATWSDPQVVTVTAVDDAISEGNHLGFIQHSVASNDPAYDGLSATTVIAAIADNDSAGIVLTPLVGNVAEGGATASYTITLQAEPTAPVTITLAPDGQVTTSVSELLFTSANWATPQVVTVTAVDDTIAEGNHVGFVAHSVASGDPNYDAAPLGAFIANIADNDGATVSIAPTNLAVAEGGVSASYAISLTSEPTAAVYVNINPDGQLTTDMAVLTFTAANWDVPQTVTVSAVDDDIAEGNHVGVIQHSVSSGDPAFDGLPAATVLANIADNDGAAVSIAPTSLTVAEGGVSASYAISLTSEPTAAVYVNISPDGQLTTDMAVLTFTAANWDVAQMVTVTAVDDTLVEGDHSGLLSHSTSSADVHYHSLPLAGMVVAIADNDLSYRITADVSLVLEGNLGHSTPITFTVQRTGGVTGTASTVDFALSGTATAGVDYGSVLPAGGQLSFAAGETSQQITLLVLGDEIDEVDESIIATLSNPTAAGTAVLAADTATTVIVDDDGTPSLNLNAPATVDEGASSVTLTVTLSHASAQTVTVDVATSDGTATAGADYAPLTQTVSIPAGQTAVTLTVAIVDDAEVEGDETFHVTLSNPQNGVLGGMAQVTITIVDNDVPPATPTIYLPLIMTAPDPTVRPDLVVSSVVVSANDIEIVITNVGGAAVTTSFWVDAFIGPDMPPTAVNQSVQELGGTNIAWGIAIPLAPGASITLRLGDANQAPQYTTHSGPIPAGVPVYVHVDAFSEGSDYGAVLEQHELDGTPYNNISGPFSH